MKRIPISSGPKGRWGAFTLIEMLLVVAVLAILVSLAAMSFLGSKTPGTRQGTILQVMQALEQARLTAIESGSKTYLGFANSSHPDEDKKLRAHILFRNYTPEERAAMTPMPPEDEYRPLSGWEPLPKGFEIATDVDGTLFLETSDSMTLGKGLPGEPLNVYAVAFGPLGQVVHPSGSSLSLAFKQSGQAEPAAGFRIHINRFTGRVTSEEGLPGPPSKSP